MRRPRARYRRVARSCRSSSSTARDPSVWLSDRFLSQCNHAEAHQICLAHLIRDAQYAIDAGDTVFAPTFKAFLKRACDIGRRRPNLADSTIKAYARTLERELDALLKLKPPNAEGRIFETP
jgi:transposase